ncbi:MAG: CHRD domain-containing protein [Thermoleophilia bacterium]|nr:CHRD domain-containing protein [Thermoleophilia bacterium]
MKRTGAILLVGLVAIALGGVALAGLSRNYSVHLTGAQELPVAIDTGAQGQAIFHLSKDGTSISYKLITANIVDVTQAHIHVVRLPNGTGPITVWLYPSAPPLQLIPGRSDGVLAEGTFTAADLVGPLAGGSLEDLLEEIAAGTAYVNVHTLANPPGEIRGDLP